MSALAEFLEFIEAAPQPAVRDLLQRVLLKSRTLTGAEAGSIFILRHKGRGKWLEVASLQNDVVKIEEKALTLPVDRSSIAGYVADTGKTVLIDDVYEIPSGRPYTFNRAADRSSGFRSKSIMCFALKNYAGQVIGVVQLINRRGAANKAITPFTEQQADLVLPFNHIVGGVIERADMIERITEQNVGLKQRSRLLARQRHQIAALKDQTEEAFQLSIRLLARAAELHDEDTGNHIVRVNEYSYVLAGKLGLPQEFCDEIRYSAQLHDICKMSVDAAVLKKRGKLLPEEWAEMNRHPVYGHQILVQSDRLKMAAEIALNHHEKWDGTGYPHGVKGEAIPLCARIVQMADIYDALRSPRVYKPAFSHEQACKIIIEGDDRIDPKKHFDPKLVALFAENHAEMARVWKELVD
ncbi:MAG: HD domain-containing protein [Proteobacteria bacterium]|nr:HD domain-containing protein [Pseudomonadota bacterium]